MEASDTSGDAPQQDPQPDQSQEQPTTDSQLTTPQPDQPAPTEAERQDDAQVSQPDSVGGSTASPGPSGTPAEGTVSSPPQFPTGAQQNDAAAQREQELEADRRAHNERTGGGEIQPGEVQQARQDHCDRTGGGQVPGVEPQASQPADGSG